ncbi:MAG TPA: ComEC/Rec2 family competence protein [Candidatus Saccharimonadales bacterium]|nr:ComEC/Rec2 family competence protein [Candidatus Saccharimonadales bacterium]
MPDVHSNPETARRRPPAAPLFAATVSFSCGILLQTYVDKPAALYFLCTIGLALCSVIALRFATRGHRALFGYIAAVLAFFPAGALLTAAHASRPAPVATVLQYAGGDEVTLTGYVARESSRRAGRDPRESMDFAVEQAQFDGEASQPVTGSARLNIYVPGSHFAWQEDDDQADDEEAAALPEFDYGQRLRIRAKLRPPVNFRNPGNMDYVGWLRGQGVAVLGSAKSTNIDVLPGADGSKIDRLRWHARRSVLRHMERLWPAPYAGLFQAMVLGERGLVTHEQRLEFQRSGTFHLLVVSGMNVAIFAVFLLWLMRWLRLPVEYAIVATIVLTCGYAWLTDLGAPILRSVIMIVAYQIAALWNRDRAPLNTVSLAALLLLVCDPQSLFDASFQLTFLAVLTIAGIGVPLFSRTTTPVREALADIASPQRDLTLRPRQAQLRLDLRAIATKLGYLIGTRPTLWLLTKLIYVVIAIAELAALSALMQAALTLPTVWYFHRVNPHAVWANMAVLPLTGLLMPTSMLAVAFSYLAQWLAAPFSLAARYALQGILLTVHWSGGTQLPDLRVAMPTLAAISAVAGAYAIALLLSRRHWILAFTSLGLLAASAWTVFQHPRPFAYQPHELEITAIDIGQGDSFLLVTPGGHTLLLDSGGLLGMSHSDLDIGEDVVSPYLWQRGLSRLDAVAFSHGHSDHMGGLTAILRNFRPNEIWYARNYPSHEVATLLATADRLHVRRIERHFGDHFDFDGIRFEVLSPPPDWELKPRGQDDASMVLRLTYAGHTALFMGDIHKRMEKLLVEDSEAHHRSLHADLLKVAHHGSNTSSCDELLDAVHPDYAVISSGIRNSFHHPRPEVIERLAEHRAKTYRTDLFGPITFYMDAAGVHPSVVR